MRSRAGPRHRRSLPTPCAFAPPSPIQGWLVGASNSFAGTGLPRVDVRVRWAEIGADITLAGGNFTVDPVVNLYQVSWHGPVTPQAAFSDANAQALLGAVLQTISQPAPAVTSPAGILLSTLTALNLAIPDSQAASVSANALNAITADAAGYLSTQLTATLNGATGFAGFTATTAIIPSRGAIATPEWTLPLSGLPLRSTCFRRHGPLACAPERPVPGQTGSAPWSIAPNTSITLTPASASRLRPHA